MPVKKIDHRTAEAWDVVLAGLYRQHEAAEAQLAGIIEQRRAVALAAAEGDAEAQAQVAALNARHVELTCQMDTLRNAADKASEHRRAAAAREEAAAQAARLAEAQATAEALMQVAEVADRAFAAAAEALTRRAELATALARLGFKVNRLHHLGPIERAAGAAGLRGRLSLHFGSPATWAPLAQHDAASLDAALAPAVEASRRSAA
jgi:hypothetical protein